LDSLAQQTANPKLYEIIIVNNHSTDNTAKICSNYSDIRYLEENNIGLSHARNTGWKNARGKYVAYIDDDAIAENTWIEEIIKFVKLYPSAQIFGGPYYKYSDISIPDWFPPEFGQHDLGLNVRKLEIKGSEWLSGNNFIIYKHLLKRLNGFDTHLGMNGTSLWYGEDSDLQLKITNLGIPIYYSGRIIIKHYLHPYKTSLIWLLKSSYCRGHCRYSSHREIPTFYKTFSSLYVNIIRAIKILTTPSPLPWKRIVYYAFEGLCTSVGMLVEYVEYNLAIALHTPWKVLPEIKMNITSLFTKQYLIYLGVKIGNHPKFYGCPKVNYYNGSSIIIGNNFENRNSWNSNPLGINHPLIIGTYSPLARIIIGDDVGISGGCICAQTSVEIGNGTLIGANCTILDTDFHPLNSLHRRYDTENIRTAPIIIGKNVFIGTGAIILRGVTIPDNSVVPAGAVIR
jgi:glycosyltransferase involved in cell wall biosynthesis